MRDWLTARLNLARWYVQNWIPPLRRRREAREEPSAQWCERRYPPRP